MRSSTQCDHFTCRNGARYGNARPWPGGIGWLQGNNQGIEQQEGAGERAGLLNPAEETAQRINIQALCVIAFAAASAVLAIYTAVTSEGGFSETAWLWSIWTTFFALPLKYLMYIACVYALWTQLRAGCGSTIIRRSS